MIHARELTKTFKIKAGTVVAVDAVNLDVEEGELVAFLGPNGAGKTTTLRMLTTLLSPTAGTATVAGHDVRTDPAGVRRCIGYIGQRNGAGHYHHVRDELVVQGYAHGLSRREAHRRADDLIGAFELGTLAKRTSGTLSGGQRRRLDIALGLMHQPAVLFLDEPSSGLDPQNRANLWEHVLAVRERSGTTLFLTTHYLEEADTMAERVMVIDHGRVIADDTPAALKENLAGDRIAITLSDPDHAGEAARVAQRIAQIRDLEAEGPHVMVRVPGGDAFLPSYLRALDVAGVVVRMAEVARPTLDDVFLALTGRSLREEAAEVSAPAIEEVAV